jgi:hypothetical protein
MKMVRSLVSALAIIALLPAGSAMAALSYNGGTFSQDFDGLPATGNVTIANRGPLSLSDSSTTTGVGTLASATVDGWYIVNPSGTSTSTEYRAQNGSLSGSAGRGVVSFGTTGSSDRALGSLATSNQVCAFGLVLTNNTATTLTSFTLGFTGEQWRRGEPAVHNALPFDYAVSGNATDNITSAITFSAVPQLTFSAPNVLDTAGSTEIALNGNDVLNQTVLSYTVGDLDWNPGEVLILRWRGQDLTGQDDGLAIDGVTFTAAVPEPASLALVGAGAMLLMWRRRS